MMRSLDDIKDYELKARLSIPEDHPYYEEITVLLTQQINHELGMFYASTRTT